jgi:excinuclease UvrABC nuclease subunit
MTKDIKKIIKNLPQSPGVYIFKDKNQKIIYIGKAVNIKKRVQSHFSSQAKKERGKGGTIIDYTKVKSIDFIPTPTEKDAIILESKLIKRNQPIYNVESKDDKNFLYIGFTSEKYPKVFLTRQPNKYKNQTQNNKNNQKQTPTFIGPFILAKETKDFLNQIRKLFPYRTCNNPPEKPCLYYHMNLCWAHLKKAKYYKKIIAGLKAIINIYNGKNSHIECYDISNTQGEFSVGSMITFINNKPQKKLYRKFKVKTVFGINDPKSLEEIINRRLLHKEWKYPDLIIVDGGKTQISRLKNIPIPVIGISKRYLKKRTKNYGVIHSPYESSGLNILLLPDLVCDTILAARNEAHRFAIKYHRERKVKNIL